MLNPEHRLSNILALLPTIDIFLLVLLISSHKIHPGLEIKYRQWGPWIFLLISPNLLLFSIQRWNCYFSPRGETFDIFENAPWTQNSVPTLSLTGNTIFYSFLIVIYFVVIFHRKRWTFPHLETHTMKKSLPWNQQWAPSHKFLWFFLHFITIFP